MLKTYLAAPYSRKDDIRNYAKELRSLGIEVTSRWLDEPHRPGVQMQELTSAEHQAYALQDVEDVKAADVLVFWTDPTKAIVRGGRHAEFGMAVILGIPILVVGKEHENIFHYLSDVTHFETWYDVREKLYETYVQKTANESL